MKKPRLFEQYLNELEKEMETLYEDFHTSNNTSVEIPSIIEDLRNNQKVLDSRFDLLFPREIRKLSAIHWTPVQIAKKVTKLFEVTSDSKILDIGSGCGKFCLIGAALAPQAQFYGVEQRSHLSIIAKKCAKDLKLRNAKFINCNMSTITWDDFNCFYFYNPFGENIMAGFNRIDSTIPSNIEQYAYYVDIVRHKLVNLPAGTKVITFHGFGGQMPNQFSCEYSEKIGVGELELWIKK